MASAHALHGSIPVLCSAVLLHFSLLLLGDPSTHPPSSKKRATTAIRDPQRPINAYHPVSCCLGGPKVDVVLSSAQFGVVCTLKPGLMLRCGAGVNTVCHGSQKIAVCFFKRTACILAFSGAVSYATKQCAQYRPALHTCLGPFFTLHLTLLRLWGL